MDKKTPLVSVICLSYNHEKYIEQSLRSVIFQTFPDFEIIYIDNCSGDESFVKGKRVLEASAATYVAYKSETNLGISEGFNYAAKNLAKGKYIATLSCDDFWDMYNLEEKVRYFESNQHYGMVYGNGYNYMDQTKEIFLYYKTPSISGHIFRKLLAAPAINPQGILYRKDVLEVLDFWDKNAKVEDRDLWLRIAQAYPIGYVHTPLTFYRIHQSNTSANLDYMREGNEHFFQKYEKDFPKEISMARMKQECFFAYALSSKKPTINTFFKLLGNYQFSVPYTREVIRCFLLMTKIKTI